MYISAFKKVVLYIDRLLPTTLLKEKSFSISLPHYIYVFIHLFQEWNDRVVNIISIVHKQNRYKK